MSNQSAPTTQREEEDDDDDKFFFLQNFEKKIGKYIVVEKRN